MPSRRPLTPPARTEETRACSSCRCSYATTVSSNRWISNFHQVSSASTDPMAQANQRCWRASCGFSTARPARRRGKSVAPIPRVNAVLNCCSNTTTITTEPGDPSRGRTPPSKHGCGLVIRWPPTDPRRWRSSFIRCWAWTTVHFGHRCLPSRSSWPHSAISHRNAVANSSCNCWVSLHWRKRAMQLDPMPDSDKAITSGWCRCCPSWAVSNND